VDGDLLFEDLARSMREAAADDARLDRLVHRRVGLLLAGVRGEVVRPERGDEDGRVQEDRPLDELGLLRGDVHRQPAAEAVADPVRGPVESLEHVGHVGGDVPWLFPGRVPVPAQVRRDHVEAVGQPLFRELAEAEPVPCDAVEADDERSLGIPPLVGIQPHACFSGS